MDQRVGFPESGMSLPIKVGRIDIPAVLQDTSTQLHHKGRVGFYCGGASVLCLAVPTRLSLDVHFTARSSHSFVACGVASGLAQVLFVFMLRLCVVIVRDVCV